MEKNKFYEKAWFAWVCLLVFPLQPVGIYLFMKYKHHKKVLRYGICVLFGCAFLGAFGTAEDVEATPKQTEISQEETTQVEPEGQPVVQVQPELEQKEEVVVTESEIHFIDTGNSDATLIINDGKAMLIDGGDNDDEQMIVQYLKNQGITELEYVIATHPHADHIGGLDAVINQCKVKMLFVANGSAETKTYTDFINAAMNKGLSPSVPLEDNNFPLGNAYFRVMNTNGGEDTNNQSLVVEYVNGEDKILLMGDAEAEVENEILSKVTAVDLLKIGHHGSKSSTTQAFLDRVNPEYGVITCGVDNQYGHPHQATMNKLQGIKVHRTDECGHIIFRSTGSGLVTTCKEGSLLAGNQKSSSSGSGSGQANNSSNSSSSSNSNSNSNSNTSSDKQQPVVPEPVVTQTPTSGGGTVYWTPNGKSYHTTKSCSTLSRSKTINSGTIKESGKYDPCDRCH